MNKPNISSIASIAEVVASVAVVISLVFVVKSLDQNTAAIRSSNDNVIYQFNDSQLRDIISDPELARLLTKFWSGEELDAVESLRIDSYHYRELAMWELAFNRHSEGLMPPYQWENWDKSFRLDVLYVSEEKWTELMAIGWGEEFLQHAHTAYAEYHESLSSE